MRVAEMWKSTLIIKILLVVVCFMLMNFGVAPLFSIGGIALLLGACFWAFRDGMNYGHQACSISDEVSRIEADEAKRAAVDPKLFKQTFSKSRALCGVLAGGLIGYAINCAYIILSLTGVQETPLYIARIASFVVSLPFWSLLSLWRETFIAITPDVAVALMAGPFLIPLAMALGYLRGPTLWAHTEEAMAAGRRRAKARSRIGANNRKRTPRRKQPEI